MFNFVKEQTQRIQKNETDIGALKELITRVEKEEIIFTKHHKEVSETLKIQKEKLISEQQHANDQLKKDSCVLEKIKLFFDKFLAKIKCNRNEIMELGGSEITNKNIMCYLGLIEQRAGSLSQAKLLLAIKNEIENSSVEKKVKISFPTVGLIARCIVAPPSLSSEIPEAPEFTRPFSQQEVKMAALSSTKAERERKMQAAFSKK